MNIINVDGFQCFYGILMTLLNGEKITQNSSILNCYMWNYGFTYDYYELQNRIVEILEQYQNNDKKAQTIIQETYGIEFEAISYKEKKEFNLELQCGKPIFVRSNDQKVYVVIDFNQDIYVLKNSEGVIFADGSELEKYHSWKINVISQQCNQYLKGELRITDHRYSLIRAVREQFGLCLEYLPCVDDLYELLQLEKNIIIRCNTEKLLYADKKQKHALRYILLKGIQNQTVHLIDSVDKKDIYIEYKNLIEDLLDHDKIIYACSWENQKKSKAKECFREKEWIKLFVQEHSEQICKNANIFYDRVYHYIEDNVLNNTERLEEKLDHIYCQFGDIEKVRSLFIDAIISAYPSYEQKIQELYEKIKNTWGMLKTLQVRIMFLKNQQILNKFRSYTEQVLEEENKLFCLLRYSYCHELMGKEEQAAELGELEVFKNLWYRDCIYHSIFTALSYYKKPIYPFLSQNIYLYDINSNNRLITMRKPINKDISTVLDSMGISLRYESVKYDIIQEVVSNIDHKRMMIIPVDKYYMEICLDTYRKVHHRHDIMIYGYNISEQKVYIIENKYLNSPLFEKKCLSFQSLYEAHLGYCCNYYDEIKKDYMCLENISDFVCDVNKIREEYTDNLKQFVSDKQESLKYIEQLMKKLLLEGQQIDTGQWLNMCNDIITNKKIELFSYRKLNVDCNYELKDSIIKTWDLVRLCLLKLDMAKNKENLLNNIHKYLDKVKCLEQIELNKEADC